MPARRSRPRNTAGAKVGKATRNYAALSAALLEGMAHDWTVKVTVRSESGHTREVTGRITRWDEDEQMASMIAGLKVSARRGHTALVFVIGGERVRLNSITQAKWLDRP